MAMGALKTKVLSPEEAIKELKNAGFDVHGDKKPVSAKVGFSSRVGRRNKPLQIKY
jgi:hypothetical protein